MGYISLFELSTTHNVAVIPVLVGPLQALIAILPGLVMAVLGGVAAAFKPSSIKRLCQLLWSQKVAVVIIVTIITLLFILVPKLFPAQAVSGAITGSDWSLWRGGLDRRGARTDKEDPITGGVNWRYEDGKTNTFYSSPAVVGNRGYVTSARRQ